MTSSSAANLLLEKRRRVQGALGRKIADALWPDEEADAAFNSLSIAIHRLRKLLGENDAILVANGTIGFNPTRCWLDLWAFERKL